MPPLALTDEQMNAVMRGAAPLRPQDRDAYLRQVAEQLRGQEPLGDGLVGRVVRDVQRRFWDPPQFATGAPGRGAKYR
jgi:hypothetical protein